MTHMFLALALLACSGASEPKTNDHTPGTDALPPPPPEQAAPEPEGEGGDPKADACKKVIKAEKANAIFEVGRALKNQGDCSFEDVGVEGSVVTLAFDTAGGSKAKATLQPVACAKERTKTAITGGPWLLEVPEASKKACPKGYEALIDALVKGRFPPPDDAE